MDIVYAGGEVSAREIWERLPGAPTYSTVRTLLAALEEKGQLVRRLVGKAFVPLLTHPDVATPFGCDPRPGAYFD